MADINYYKFGGTVLPKGENGQKYANLQAKLEAAAVAAAGDPGKLGQYNEALGTVKSFIASLPENERPDKVVVTPLSGFGGASSHGYVTAGGNTLDANGDFYKSFLEGAGTFDPSSVPSTAGPDYVGELLGSRNADQARKLFGSSPLAGEIQSRAGGLPGGNLSASGSTGSPLQNEIMSRAGAATPKDELISKLTSAVSSKTGFDPGARLQELQKERGVTQLKQTLSTFDQEIAKTNQFLDDLEKNITERTKGFLVSEPQRARIEASERSPLIDQLNKLSRSKGVAESSLSREQSDIMTLLGLEEQKAGSPLEGIMAELAGRGNIESLFAPAEAAARQDRIRSEDIAREDTLRKEALAREDAATNKDFALKYGVNQPLYQVGNVIYNTKTGVAEYENVGGELRRLSDNKRYSEDKSFFADSGIKSWNQVQQIKTGQDSDLYTTDYKNYLLSKQEGFNGTFEQWQTIDANRKKSNITVQMPGLVKEFEYAKTKGFDGDLFGYIKAKAEAGNVDSKLPWDQ